MNDYYVFNIFNFFIFDGGYYVVAIYVLWIILVLLPF
jgi:hypothetical protein